VESQASIALKLRLWGLVGIELPDTSCIGKHFVIDFYKALRLLLESSSSAQASDVYFHHLVY
jgi:hypothetical protein